MACTTYCPVCSTLSTQPVSLSVGATADWAVTAAVQGCLLYPSYIECSVLMLCSCSIAEPYCLCAQASQAASTGSSLAPCRPVLARVASASLSETGRWGQRLVQLASSAIAAAFAL